MRREACHSAYYQVLSDEFTDFHELSNVIGVSVRTVSRIMSGQRSLTHLEKLAISEYLGKQIDSIFPM